MPFVFLELKDAAYNTDAIDWIWAEVLELGLVNHVALYVMDDEQPDMLAQQTHWQGLLVRGFRVMHLLCSLVAHLACISDLDCSGIVEQHTVLHLHANCLSVSLCF